MQHHFFDKSLDLEDMAQQLFFDLVVQQRMASGSDETSCGFSSDDALLYIPVYCGCKRGSERLISS